MSSNIKEAYSKLKYKLPVYDEINNEFEISSLESDDFLLRNILRKIVEKLEAYSKIIEDILNPEGTIAGLYESPCFDEKGKKEIFEIYKKIMALDREMKSLIIEGSDEKTADFLNENLNSLKEVKKEMAKLLKTLEQYWKETKKVKPEVSYLG